MRNLRRLMYMTGGAAPMISDSDALAYITAVESTGITIDAAFKTAIHQFYIDLKADGIYSQLHTMYITRWGTAAANKFNAINPLDTDAAFRLTFYNSPTHSADGIHWNGSSQYADTHFVPSANYTASSGAVMGYLSISNTSQGDVYEIGAYNGNSQAHFLSLNNGGFSPARPYLAQYVAGLADNPLSTTAGFFVMRRKAVGETVGGLLFQNGNIVLSAITEVVAESAPTVSVFLGALNAGGGPYGYSNRGVSFAFQAGTLTDSQILILDTKVKAFLTNFD